MFPQGSESGALQLMQGNKVLAPYASASTKDQVSRGINNLVNFSLVIINLCWAEAMGQTQKILYQSRLNGYDSD